MTVCLFHLAWHFIIFIDSLTYLPTYLATYLPDGYLLKHPTYLPHVYFLTPR